MDSLQSTCYTLLIKLHCMCFPLFFMTDTDYLKCAIVIITYCKTINLSLGYFDKKHYQSKRQSFKKRHLKLISPEVHCFSLMNAH